MARTQKPRTSAVPSLDRVILDTDVSDGKLHFKKFETSTPGSHYIKESFMNHGGRLRSQGKVNSGINRRFKGPKRTFVRIPRGHPSAKKRIDRARKLGLNPQVGNISHRAPNSKRRHAKEALKKDEQAITKAGLQHHCKTKSAWFNSIMDPLGHGDVKVPDDTGLQTGTVQFVQRLVFSSCPTATAGAGMGGIRIVTPYINERNGGVPSGSNFQFLHDTSTSIAVQWANTVSGGIVGNYDSFAINDKFREIAQGHRIVSAELSVVPQMSSLKNSGTLIASIKPYSFSSGTNSISNYMKRFGASTVSVNSGQAAFARWVPISYKERSYKAFWPLDMTTITDEGDSCPPWEICVVGEGLETSVNFVATIVVNYEYIPTDNTVDLVDSAPSPQDTMEEDLVKTWIQEEPITGQVAAKDVEKAPTATDKDQGGETDTGFGMLGQIVEEIAPIATGLLALL